MAQSRSSKSAVNSVRKPARDFVQAVRCKSCHRLRAYPSPSDLLCACGSLQFVTTIPHEDEMPLAMKLYEREIEDLFARHPEKVKEI